MSDIKLFRLNAAKVTELVGTSVVIEKQLQDLMERNLDAFLGVRFLASEYSTGKTHGGRIDTLGIDENYAPVIIEYKRSLNENVINQGLFYLDWLLDHKGEFTLLAMKQDPTVEAKIDWAGSRLVCIASDFTRYDEHAVSQIQRNIELLRYRRYGDELLLLEQVNASSAEVGTSSASSSSAKGVYKGVADYLKSAPPDLLDVYTSLDAHLAALGDVQVKITKQYVAYRRIKNFACVEVHPQAKKLLLFVKVNPDTVALRPGFSRDVRAIGHFGTGDLELTLTSLADVEEAKVLIQQSYEAS